VEARRPRGPSVREAAARDLARAGGQDAPIPALREQAGYRYPEAFNATLSHRRWLCRPTAVHRTHHLHLVDERAELARHLRFTDLLRASATLRREYARLKRDLAECIGDDREAYSEAKSAFIDRVKADARHVYKEMERNLCGSTASAP
jgi:GrpB-like predicted nucleotidyltransferase (UPF0157 family)